MRAAGLSESALADVRYPPPRRLASVGRDSPFRLERIELRLEDATMQQITRFAHHLLTQRSGLFVHELRLIGKPDANPDDSWTADPLTLAFLTDQPQDNFERSARK